MTGLMMHTKGCVADVTMEQLREVVVPDRTRSYMPVEHHDLVSVIRDKAAELFNPMGFEEKSLQLGLARGGMQLFGHLAFLNGRSDSMGMAIGFRNSYDKTLPVGIGVGSHVFVCDNLALGGDIKIFRKHTYRVWDDLRTFISNSLGNAPDQYDTMIEDAKMMGQDELTNDGAFEILGKLYGHDILTVTQLTVAKKEWLVPSHPEFEPRTKWSLFNAVTESLKGAHPRIVMQQHTQAYKMLTA